MKGGPNPFEDIGSIELFPIPCCTHDPAVVNPSWAPLLVWPIGALAAGPGGWMTSGNPVKEIKAMVGWPICEGLGEIGICPALGGGAVLAAVSDPEVPFPHHPGSISITTEKRGNCRARFFDQGVTLDSKENPVFERTTPAIAPGEQRVAGGAAAAVRGVGVHEPYAHVGNTLHVGGMELPVILIAGPVLVDGGVSHSHVVCQKNNDIGIGGTSCSAGEKEQEACSKYGEQE